MPTVITSKVTKVTIAQKILEVAKAEIGKSEIPKGSNWGEHVQKYLASVGINFAAPWCMAFVYWCVNASCNQMKVTNPIFRTGGVLDQYNKCKQAKVKYPKLQFEVVATPKAGDIFIMDFGKGLGHAGFVEKVTGLTIQTIEGNSNDEGSREGYEVCRKPGGRKISTIKAFIRLI